jgi:hypothetical protein
MSHLTLLLSTLFALTGIGCAIVGITGEQWKPVAVGLVLLLGAGVFATLYAGTRLTLQRSGHSGEDGMRGSEAGD